MVTLVSRALLDFFLLDCNVSIWRTYRILFDWIVTSVSRPLLQVPFIRLLRKYLARVKDSLSLDFYDNILRTFGTFSYYIFTLVSHAILEFPLIGLLRY